MQRPRPLPHVTTRCTGCGRCVGASAPRVLWLETRHWRKQTVLHTPADCTSCSVCAAVCPFSAIQMVRPATIGEAERPPAA